MINNEKKPHTNMPEELLYLIIKRLTNTITSEEASVLQQWISLSAANRKIFDEVSDIWLASAPAAQKEFDTFKALEKVTSRIQKPELHNTAKKNKRFINPFIKIAAFALILMGVGSLTYFAGRQNNTTKETFTNIEAPMGSRTRVNLPDGTKVWLNGGSSLKFSNAFNKSERMVTLSGEGFFDVVHNAQVPFVLKAHRIRVKVLGTAFNVKAYQNDGIVETTLERGSLAIEKILDNGETIPQAILKPNERATFIPKDEGMKETVNEQFYVTKNVETQIYTSWKDDKLVFRNESFVSLTLKLERWYGVNIKIEDAEIEKYHFNGTFEKESINDVLKIIHFTLPVKYIIDHNRISISLDKTATKKAVK